MQCCAASKPTAITVTKPDGKVVTVATRPEALAVVTRAGGGVIKGA